MIKKFYGKELTDEAGEKLIKIREEIDKLNTKKDLFSCLKDISAVGAGTFIGVTTCNILEHLCIGESEYLFPTIATGAIAAMGISSFITFFIKKFSIEDDLYDLIKKEDEIIYDDESYENDSNKGKTL